MRPTWSRLVLAGVLTVFPLAVHAASDPPAPSPKPLHLVVDSESTPVVSVRAATQLVEIVLLPSQEYRPVHPDSIEAEDKAAPPEPDPAPAR
jgi:hypothetical protein